MQKPNILFGEDGKPRSGWRFAIFLAVFTLPYLFFLSAVAVVVQALHITPESSGSGIFLIHGLVAFALALIAGWFCGSTLEGLSFETLGASFTNNWLRHLLIGLAAGAITFGVGAGVGMLFGGLSFSFNAEGSLSSTTSTLVLSFLFFGAAAAFEEALFRGYMLQTFVRSDLRLFGVVLTSVLFASIHNLNPSANLISWANTFLAGIWFGVAYLKTRDLWFPTGLHLAWNWTQGSIFGVEVSGLTDIVKQPLLRETDVGPAWLTGGDYGIEGGIATTVALILATILIHFLPFRSSSQE